MSTNQGAIMLQPIGLSVVRLERVAANILHVENVDILDQTPLLDIKPYVPAFDHHPVERTGWLADLGHRVHECASDNRFLDSSSGTEKRRSR